MDRGVRTEDAVDDKVLIRRVADQDRTAFAGLYDRHAAAVFSFAQRLVGPSVAEDSLQEVFLRVWSCAGQYRADKAAVRTWIMAIARNTVIDALRRRRREVERDAALTRLELDLVAPEEPQAALETSDQANGVRAALRSLPDEQRRAVVYAYFGGLTHTELARKLGLPLGTVKKRLRLGLNKLRLLLGSSA